MLAVIEDLTSLATNFDSESFHWIAVMQMGKKAAAVDVTLLNLQR